MKFKSVSLFFAYFIPTAVLLLGVWYFLGNGYLYYCADNLPLVNFFPPFVHNEYGDYYIAAPTVVYLTWLAFIIVGVGIPFILTKKTLREDIVRTTAKIRTLKKK